MTNPFLNRDKVNDGRKAEKRQAKSLGMKLQPASGAMDGAKGDMKSEYFLIECKSTQSDTLPLKLSWLDKISKEALHTGRNPAVVLVFVYPNGTPVTNGEWVAIPTWLAKERGFL